jgi:hypothetical protein
MWIGTVLFSQAEDNRKEPPLLEVLLLFTTTVLFR